MLLLFQLVFFVTILIDIPVARTIIGFFYITFIPGFLIFRLIETENFGALEKILFSLGLSIAFLMISGLLINELSLLSGFSRPFSTTPLLVILNGCILVITFFAYLRNGKNENFSVAAFPSLLWVLPLFGLLALSIIGTFWVNVYANNTLLLLLIIAISIVFGVGALLKKSSPTFFIIAVFVIAISLLYHASLISTNVVSFGSDISLEFFVFRTTQINAFWSPSVPFLSDLIYGRYQSMLSITILPTIYSNLLGLNQSWTFKLIYPFIFSFVPLALYSLWSRFIEKKYAFISAFLFMAFGTFYTEMLGLNRQIIAELFLVLLLIVIFNKKLNPLSKTSCFLIFSFGLVTSHYGLAIIFLFLISCIFIYFRFVKLSNTTITPFMLVSLAVIMFAWYVFTADSTVFTSIQEFGTSVLRQLGDFFDISSRGTDVLRGIGLEASPSILNTVSRIFAYLTQALIVCGFVSLFTKRKTVTFEKTYGVLIFVAMVFLVGLILVPGLANTLNLTRFYHILLFILAPLCVIGVQFIMQFFSKRKSLVPILLVAILIPYFLFQSGFLYEITGHDSYSLPLSKDSMPVPRLYGDLGYMDTQSIVGAQWLSQRVNLQQFSVYSDTYSHINVLTSYGLIPRNQINELLNTTVLEPTDEVYLDTLNIQGNAIYSYGVWNFSQLSFNFSDLNMIYSNGNCQIYEAP